MYDRILIANDGSEEGRNALSHALELGKRLGAAVHMISVVELPRFTDSIGELVEEKERAIERFRRAITHAQTKAAMQNIELKTHVLTGRPVARIIEFISEGHFDLLVVGQDYKSGLLGHLLGSMTDRLVWRAPCAVMVIK